MSKCVRWSTITVYEFGVGIGGSAVPKRGGPSVGLARTPECVWSTTVDAADSAATLDHAAVAVEAEGKLPGHVTTKTTTAAATATASSADERNGRRGSSPAKSSSSSPSKRCRQRRVRWLKPLERVAMLEKAGYSEKRIYRMLMESSQIAMSRRLCLRLPVDDAAATPAVRSQ